MKPNTKVQAGGAAGAVSVLALLLVKEVWQVELSAEVGAAIASVAGFAIAYLVPEKVAKP